MNAPTQQGFDYTTPFSQIGATLGGAVAKLPSAVAEGQKHEEEAQKAEQFKKQLQNLDDTKKKYVDEMKSSVGSRWTPQQWNEFESNINLVKNPDDLAQIMANDGQNMLYYNQELQTVDPSTKKMLPFFGPLERNEQFAKRVDVTKKIGFVKTLNDQQAAPAQGRAVVAQGAAMGRSGLGGTAPEAPAAPNTPDIGPGTQAAPAGPQAPATPPPAAAPAPMAAPKPATPAPQAPAQPPQQMGPTGAPTNQTPAAMAPMSVRTGLPHGTIDSQGVLRRPAGYTPPVQQPPAAPAMPDSGAGADLGNADLFGAGTAPQAVPQATPAPAAPTTPPPAVTAPATPAPTGEGMFSAKNLPDSIRSGLMGGKDNPLGAEASADLKATPTEQGDKYGPADQPKMSGSQVYQKALEAGVDDATAKELAKYAEEELSREQKGNIAADKNATEMEKAKSSMSKKQSVTFEALTPSEQETVIQIAKRRAALSKDNPGDPDQYIKDYPGFGQKGAIRAIVDNLTYEYNPDFNYGQLALDWKTKTAEASTSGRLSDTNIGKSAKKAAATTVAQNTGKAAGAKAGAASTKQSANTAQSKIDAINSAFVILNHAKNPDGSLDTKKVTPQMAIELAMSGARALYPNGQVPESIIHEIHQGTFDETVARAAAYWGLPKGGTTELNLKNMSSFLSREGTRQQQTKESALTGKAQDFTGGGDNTGTTPEAAAAKAKYNLDY
jgi:hypothetical protein